MKRRIIIDTDSGHDDALAIMLLEKSGLFDIMAVTTVAGNSTIENATNNARFILDLVESRAPLYSGASKPLKRELVKADVHGESGLEGADVVKREELFGTAPQKIAELLKKYPREVSILSLGPQTNIAKAFQLDSRLPELVSEIIIMGGAIEVPGNKNRVAEFNIFVDPEAADIVLRSIAKKVMIPLDACNQILLSVEDFEAVRDEKLRHSLLKMMIQYGKGVSLFEHTTGLPMYDPLAAYYLINPDAYELVPMDIEIETMSDLTRGMTVADRRVWGYKKPNIEVATRIDGKAFKKDFIKTLNM